MPHDQLAGLQAPPMRRRKVPAMLRGLACLAVLAALAACATHPRETATQEAAQYAAHAKRDYTPPGPPGDPWGPYIVEAAAKYDMPERWIREVMRAESGGRMYEHGTLITSDAGAMGLMQVMPITYDELRARYDLGDDPYDPHDNILAGAAYLRELYDAYGSPAFLAAYNAGPGRLDDYLTRNRPLPDETRHYVAKIGPYIQDTFPQRPSAARSTSRPARAIRMSAAANRSAMPTTAPRAAWGIRTRECNWRRCPSRHGSWAISSRSRSFTPPSRRPGAAFT
jgi:soluble lytic murein transglycosylase-like protein